MPPECLYKTLSVSEAASDVDIKKAYRALALACHPDKNRDDPEKAEERFKQIQHAYTVLSDPHERAWYDSHRTEILHTSPSGTGSASSATSLDLFSYFSPSAYSRFDDSPKGFYPVYTNVFQTLWEEEVAAGRSGSSPPFGGSEDSWSVVRDFYGHWDAFTSAKTFSYADKWRLPEAPNREVRRAMERENRRERNKAKKEFNTNIRELVAFVKKRDPRVARRKEEEAHEKELAESKVKQRAEERKRERAKDAERTRAARDEALEEDAEGLDEILANIVMDEERDRQRGRRKGKRKNRILVVEDDEQSNDEDEKNEQAENDDEMDDGEKMSHGNEDDETNEDGSQIDKSDAQVSEPEEELENLYCAACRKPFRTPAQMIDHERSKKHKAALAKLRKQLMAEDDAFATISKEDAMEAAIEEKVDDNMNDYAEDNEPPIQPTGLSKKAKKKARRRATIQKVPEPDEISDEDVSQKDTPQGFSNRTETINVTTSTPPAGDDTTKMSKKEKRKLREARKKAASAASNQTIFKCNVCAAEFSSRSQLMRHVKSEGHALHVDKKQ